jgi:hypothetical protein
MEPRSTQATHDSAHDDDGRAVQNVIQDSTASARLERIPKEVGLLLLASGMITGMLPPPPGPFDLSLMLTGGVALWPRGFKALEGWMRRNCPQAHRAGVSFLERFLEDLEHRFPDSTSSRQQRGEGSDPLPGLPPRR